MSTSVERNFRLSGIIDCAYSPASGAVSKKLSNIDVQAWHQTPTGQILLGQGLTNDNGEYTFDIQISSPVSYIENGKIKNVIIKTFYNGLEIEPVQLDADAKLYLDQLTPAPSLAYRLAINNLIVKLKEDNNWQWIDRLWNFATETRAHALISIKNPLTTQITEVATPTWTAGRGYTGNGTTQYLNSNYRFDNGGLYAVNNASFGCYIRTDVNSAAIDMGVTQGTNSCLITARNTNLLNTRINVAASISVANSVGTGFYAAVRNVSTTQQGLKNGNVIASGLNAATSLANIPLFILAQNNGGTPAGFSTRQISMAFVGTANIDQLKLYNAIQTFATTIGFNI